MAHNSFAPLADKSNRFSRKWAGTKGSAVDPYIKGYFFTHYSYLPPSLLESVRFCNPNSDFKSQDEIASTLQSSCLSVTLPGGTLNKTEFNGLGGITWSVPTNITYDNTVSMRFLEFQSTPIHSVLHGWVRMIRDYRAGVSRLADGDGDSSYQKSNYSGTMYYWTTRPDGRIVEYYACISGMFPLRDPTDMLGHDLTDNDKLEIDVDFNCDYVWHEAWAKSRCQQLSDIYFGSAWTRGNYGATIDNYGANDDGNTFTNNS